MDVLSLSLAKMRLSSSLLARYDAAEPWSVDVTDGRAITAYFMMTGACWFCPEDAAPVRLHKGDLLMLPHWQAHRLCSCPDLEPVSILEVAERSGSDLWDASKPLVGVRVLDHRSDRSEAIDAQLLVMMFKADDSFGDSLVSCLPARFVLPAGEVEFAALIAAVREFVADEIDARPNGYAAVGHRLAELLFIELLRSVVSRRPSGTTGWLKGLGQPSVAKAMTALHLEPQRRWTLDLLARKAGLSRSQFSAQFSKAVGQSAMAYAQGVRLQWASEEILTGVPIKEVAETLAYATPYGFHKAFTQHFGRPPGEWRKRYQRGRHGSEQADRAEATVA